LELLNQKICHDVEEGFVAKPNVKLDRLSAKGASEKLQSALQIVYSGGEAHPKMLFGAGGREHHSGFHCLYTAGRGRGGPARILVTVCETSRVGVAGITRSKSD
jgi:hypothetical protein